MLKSKSVCYEQIWPTGSVAGRKGQERSQTANIAEWLTGKGGRAAPGLVSHADVISGLQQTFGGAGARDEPLGMSAWEATVARPSLAEFFSPLSPTT